MRWKLPFTVGIIGVVIWFSTSGLRSGELVTQVGRSSLVIGVPTSGVLRAVDTVEIKPPKAGRMWNFRIEWIGSEGSKVTVGEPILAFDTSELKKGLHEASSEAEAAVAELTKTSTDLDIERNQLSFRLEEAKARYRRAKLAAGTDQQVFARSESRKAALDLLLAQEEHLYLEASLAQHRIRRNRTLETLRARIESRQERVRDLRKSIELMTVRAPQDGTLVITTGWEGRKRQVGDRAWRMETILELPNLERMEAVAEVDEASAGRLGLGQPVSLRLDSYPEKEYSGHVSQIRRVVQRRSAQDPAKIVRLEVALDQTDALRMRPGMRFRGTIATDSIPYALVVSREAVKSDKGGAFVLLKGTLGDRKVYPDLGRSNKNFIEVISGLEEGDRVIMSPARPREHS